MNVQWCWYADEVFQNPMLFLSAHQTFSLYHQIAKLSNHPINMQFDRAYSFLMQKLEQELPPHLTYHNATHTKDVLQTAQQLAAHEGITGDMLQILNTAALFHDCGFLEGHDNHEERSCQLARTYLPQYEYTGEQIEAVCKLILATKVPQRPTTTLERILCDADLAYLGSDAYEQRAGALFSEMKAAGLVSDWKEWQHLQLRFLKSHHFYTQTALNGWTRKKADTLRRISLQHAREHEHGQTNKNTAIVQDAFLIVLGVITAGFGLRGFLVPNHFFDGGVTGISLLVHEFYRFDLSVLTVALNLPFIAAAFFVVSRRFAYRTLASVLLLALCLLYIPYPTITSDRLLISIFGGIFIGLGSGLVMRAGCALDGIEVLALYTLKRTSFSITEIILAINIIIFGIAGLHFGMETALYSVLTYLAATRTIDFVVEGLEAYTGVTIISGNSDVIKSRLVNELGRSITIYKGERGYLPGSYGQSDPCDIIFTVITRLELRKLKNVVAESDPNAFVFANTIREASGGIIKRRHVH
jgi:uncharacterized membrane-anchored protein YitT (DUF2179 family)/predicted metal-dependent HD superfamily phosphohydrolase